MKDDLCESSTFDPLNKFSFIWIMQINVDISGNIYI